tara:strand:- start:6495 stop:6659 length:165 start_codon:yes stop_codon:yes gene_type:complete
MQPIAAGVSAGAIIGLGLAVSNVVTRTFFGTGWITWSLSSVGYTSNSMMTGGPQ